MGPCRCLSIYSHSSHRCFKEEKDTLFEELSKESDSSYTAVVNVRSSLAKFEQKKEANERSTSKTKECVSPSALMEMILAAYYRGLIDQVSTV